MFTEAQLDTLKVMLRAERHAQRYPADGVRGHEWDIGDVLVVVRRWAAWLDAGSPAGRPVVDLRDSAGITA